MKKVLIITYYWPPSGGSGVQRWLKMSKYLHEYGWEPIIYTADGGEAPALDHSLERDVRHGIQVIKRPILEPYSLYKRFVGQDKKEGFGAGFLNEKKKTGWAQKVSIWIRGNFFIPDARMLWIKPSARYLNGVLKENPVDAIISTGPPHSMHLIAQRVVRGQNIPWVADFRDPWTTIDFYDQLMLSRWADRKHHRLERDVVQQATCVVSVSPSWANTLSANGAQRVEVITNGFDHADFEAVDEPISSDFVITHIGSMNKDRNPKTLWRVLAQKCAADKAFAGQLHIQLIGKTDHTIFTALEEAGLHDHVRKVAYLPHHEVVEAMSRSAVMLLPINDTPNVQGVIPGKLFEYMAVKRPILCVGPPAGDAGTIVAKAQAGHVVGFDDLAGTEAAVNDLYDRFKKGTMRMGDNPHIQKYTRRSLAGDYAKLLDSL